MGVIRRRLVPGLVHCGNHGSRCKSLLLGRMTRRYGIVPSMGAIFSPWDNAVAEGLISTIKTECAHRRIFKIRDDARLETFDYMEAFCNGLKIIRRSAIRSYGV